MHIEDDELLKLVLTKDDQRNARAYTGNERWAGEVEAAVDYLRNWSDEITDRIAEACSMSRQDGIPTLVGAAFSSVPFPTDEPVSSGLMASIGYDEAYDTTSTHLFHAVMIDLSEAGLGPNPEGRGAAFMIIDALHQFYYEQRFPVAGVFHRPSSFYAFSEEALDDGREWDEAYEDGTFVGYYAGYAIDDYTGIYSFRIF